MRHRPGGVGLRPERPGITRFMGPSMSWDPWPRSVVRAGMGGGRRSVHKSAKTTSRRRFGALVYTVAPLRTDVRTQECTQIGENGLSAPFWDTCVHCCDTSRIGWHEPQPPWRAGGAPSVAASRLVGKTGLFGLTRKSAFVRSRTTHRIRSVWHSLMADSLSRANLLDMLPR